MSATVTEATNTAATATPPVPKRITNAQTVCNERNEKNKLCNGHLKQLKTAGEASEVHLRGDDVLFKCQICGTLYMGPVGSSRVDLQACKLEYSIVSPK